MALVDNGFVDGPIFSHEVNLWKVFVPIGVVGLVGSFWYAITAAQAKTGMNSQTIFVTCVIFFVSLLLAVLGGHVKVISSLSSGLADDEEDDNDDEK